MELNPDNRRPIPAHSAIRINNAYMAEALDISEDGMFVFSPHTYIPDSQVELAVTIGGDITTLSGKIVNVQPGLGFEVSFPEIPDEVEGLFREILLSAIEDVDED